MSFVQLLPKKMIGMYANESLFFPSRLHHNIHVKKIVHVEGMNKVKGKVCVGRRIKWAMRLHHHHHGHNWSNRKPTFLSQSSLHLSQFFCVPACTFYMVETRLNNICVYGMSHIMGAQKMRKCLITNSAHAKLNGTKC